MKAAYKPSLFMWLLCLGSTALNAQDLAELLVQIHAADSTLMLATVPASDSGHLIYNTDNERLFVWNGDQWIPQGNEVSLIQDTFGRAVLVKDIAGENDTIQLISEDVDNALEVGGDAGIYYDGSVMIHFGTFIIEEDSLSDIVISGIPFAPTKVKFVAHKNVDSLNVDNDNSADQNNNAGINNAFGPMDGYAQMNPDGSISQQCISGGAHGNSINDISRYASNQRAIGIRYGNQNGNLLGHVFANVQSFNSDGFTIEVEDSDDRIVIMYTAYK